MAKRQGMKAVFDPSYTNESEDLSIDESVSFSQSSNETSNSQSTTDYKLSELEAVACATVLEEAVDSLQILGQIGSLPKVEADLDYKTLEERFHAEVADSLIFDPETIEPYAVALDKLKFVKFQKDRSYVEKIIKQTMQELTSTQTYQFLVQQVKLHDRKFEEEKEILDKELKNKLRLLDLQGKMETERRQAQTKIQECSQMIGNLKDQYEDLIFENKIKVDYLENWENSRMEQNSTRLDKQEDSYTNVINTTKADIEKEIRIAAEIEAYITESQKEYEDEIFVWMERYDKEVELRDTEIQVLKEKREDQFNRLQEISNLYDQHKQDIDDYLKLKDLRRQEAELLEKKIKAATKIQAWWRGTMVRKGFGQFSKKKGKKGKNGKGGDKKKGKK